MKKNILRKLMLEHYGLKFWIVKWKTGTPYMLYKDSCNMKSNQKNLGTIKSSNLCCEIIEYSDDKESAVCNLASISLSSFVKQENYIFNDNITIYTTDKCIWCKRLKNFLLSKNIFFKEIYITKEKIR